MVSLFSLPSLVAQQADPQNPVVFVTQVPVPADFATIGSTFGNHIPSPNAAIRGGDLWIRYPDGTLKNLTQAAGFGTDGFQGSNAIAVRNPQVHWHGDKVIFSMVVGNPSQQYDLNVYYWQLYEVTGLGLNDTPVITKVANQPEDYNNVYPVYASDDQIIFCSDRPRRGARHHYPVQDEYDQAPSLTGLYKLNPQTGVLDMLNHVPSGAFSPIISSDGRVIFTRWDHLQRDQQASNPEYGSFNYASEAPDAAMLDDTTEYFPESRFADGNVNGHRFNHFFPWQINEDGTEEEFLNHGGRHELASYFNRAFNDDPGQEEHILEIAPAANQNPVLNFFMIHEDPTQPGRFIGIDAPEFQSHSSGQILALNAPMAANPDEWQVDYLTHPDTRNVSNEPTQDHSGLYRDVLPLSDGRLIAAHTSETRADSNEGSNGSIASRYDYRLRWVTSTGNYLAASDDLVPAISKSISFWTPDSMRTFSGNLWQLDPVELVARQRPTPHQSSIPNIEAQVIADTGVDLNTLKSWMIDNDLALIVSRNVTSRDSNDRQQPFNLQVAGTNTISDTSVGNLYQVRDLQLFQADHLRSWGGIESPRAGRRVLAWPMHEDQGSNIPNPGGAPNSVRIGADGSMAAFVPAERALTWQLTGPQGEAVVRERYWVTFQPGEVRVCASCHGLNTEDQLGRDEPTNPPQALADLLEHWKTITDDGNCTFSEAFMNAAQNWPNQSVLNLIPLSGCQ